MTDRTQGAAPGGTVEAMPPTLPPAGRPDRATAGRALAVVLIVLVVGLAFVWSYVGALHEPRFHGVPLVVVGPPALATQLERGDAFEVTQVATRADAVRALRDREAFGGVVAGARQVELLTASAAGLAVAEGLRTDLRPRLATQTGATVRVTDVRPLPRVDARGISPFYLAVGLVVAGYLGAAFLGLVFGTKPSGAAVWWRLLALGCLAVPMGLASVLLVHGIGPLRGHTAALALAGMLLCFVVANVAVGLQSAFGVAGTGLAILLFVVLGNPASGGPFATDLLPQPWRAIGADLPTGAGVDLIRNIAYFDGHATLRPIIVLLTWLAVGLALVLVFARRPARGLQTAADRERAQVEAEAMSAAAAG